MLTGLSVLLFGLAALAFLTLLGYGPVRLLLPRRWRSEEGLLAPLVGCCFLLLVGFYGVRVMSLRGVLWLALGLGLALAGLALWRHWKEPFGLNWREHGPVWLIALLSFALAVLPLLRYGYLTPIGENWDPENYLPVTEYLLQGAVGRIAGMPPNPIRDLNASPPRIGLTLGFSVLQGVLQQLAGWEAHQSFAPTLALLRGLTVPALYLLFRWGLRMSRLPALLATLLAGLHALSLWLAFFNFGMQVSSLPLVPLAWALFLLVLRHPSPRTVLLAAVAIAAMPVAYYPALTLFVPVALGLGLYEVVRSEKRGKVLAAGLATALLSLLLALGTLLDYGEGFAFRYSQQMTTLGLFYLIPLDQLLGLTPFSRQPEALFEPGKALQVVAVVLIGLGVLASWGKKQRRRLWPAALLPALLYLGWLRGWGWEVLRALSLEKSVPAAVAERLRAYPYAYMKGAVFVAPLFLAAALDAWGATWEGVRRRWAHPWRTVALAGLVLLLLLPVGLVLRANAGLVARYARRPAHFGPEVLLVEEAVSLLPEGASVYLTGHPQRSRPQVGFFAYLLHESPVYGRLNTAYAGWDRRVPGDAPAYALLDADDNPLALGFFPEGQRWAGGGMVLYERDPAVRSFLDLRSDAYSGRPGPEVHTNSPLTERQLYALGAYPRLEPGDRLALFADGERLSAQDDLAGIPGRGSLLLALAALEPAQAILYRDGEAVAEVDLPAGLSLYRSGPLGLPARLEVKAAGDAPLWPCWAALAGEDGESLRPFSEAALLWPVAVAEGETLVIDITSLHEGTRPLRLALEVWADTYQGADHYAWWGLLPLPAQGQVRLQADLAGRQARAWVDDAEVPFPPHPGADAWPAAADGPYFAALWVYSGHHVLDVLPLAHFRLAGGVPRDLEAISSSLRLLWLHGPATPSGAYFGPAIALNAYERPAGPFAPGDELPLALEWHALEQVPLDYFVTAQILAEGRLWGQWDGPVGQWFPATAWQPGQYVRDDIPLRVDPATPPGRYRLIVAVYDPATGERLPVMGPAGEPLGDVLDLGEVVVRR